MKTIVTLALIFFSLAIIAQTAPEKAPVDPNYSITDAEMEEMKQNGIILPPIKPGFDPWAKYQYKGPVDFPIVYDMRQTPWLTPVKGQSGGACWAYSTMGAVESRWLMLGLGEYNLSDNNLKYCHLYVPERSTWGNHWMASAYFARRSGPFLESQDPYPGGTTSPDNCPTNLTPLKYITDSRYPPSQNMNAIKQTVLETGLVWSLLYYSDTYYNSTKKTYYYSGTHEVNHAGCVIGWNDTLQTAGGTGAWIVRNTYGQGWGEGGYYYISYNDSQFTKYNGFWPNVMDNEPNTTIYQYDEIGGYWGVGFNNEVGYGLVKFEGIAQDTRITKIGTFLVSYGCGVEIKIYDEFNTVLSGLLCSKDEVICELPGYYTFDLDSAVVIPAGEDFYIQVKYDSNDPTDKWPIAIEDAIPGYSNPELESGKCWIAPNPVTWPTYWYPVGANTSYKYDLCIKAYAENIFYPTVAISSPIMEEKFCDSEIQVSGTASDDNGNLSMVEVRLNGGNWQNAAGTANWTLDLTLSPGINTIEARAKDATGFFSNTEAVEVNYSVQTIPLIAGWSAISAYLDPDDPNIVNMMQSVAANLILVAGKNGIYALPPFNINTLINWFVLEGYKIKMTAPDELTFCGDALANNSVSFSPGFWYIPVLTNQISPIDEIFNNPQDNILYLYDISTGKVYWPGGGLSTLTELEPGKGYMANFINPVTIDFPEYNHWFFDKKEAQPKPESPWPIVENFNVHLFSIEKNAFIELQPGYIGAFNGKNQCVGFVKINENDGNILLTVYGDDEFTESKDGADEDEMISFKYLNSLNNSEERLIATFDPQMPQHDGTFAINGLSKITGLFKTSNGHQEIITEEMIQVFPQPAKGKFNVILPGTGKTWKIELVSLDGKSQQNWQVQNSSALLSLENTPPGLYLLKFQNNDFLIFKKLMVE